MDAERIKVLHITDGDAVVVSVSHHLVLDLLPAAQALLNQELWGEGESFLRKDSELLIIVTEATT